jgi:hypothetical protein
MRKLFLLLALLPALTACQTTQAPSVSPVVNTVVGILPDQVRDIAVKTCGFLPAAETVLALISTFGGPTVPGIATQIASEICAAVTKPRAFARRSMTPTVRGVRIRGQFVQQ